MAQIFAYSAEREDAACCPIGCYPVGYPTEHNIHDFGAPKFGSNSLTRKDGISANSSIHFIPTTYDSGGGPMLEGTMQAWLMAKFPSSSGSYSFVITSRWGATGTVSAAQLSILSITGSTNYTMTSTLYNLAGTVISTHIQTFTEASIWHHIEMSWLLGEVDGNHVNHFVDGVLVKLQNVTPTVTRSVQDRINMNIAGPAFGENVYALMDDLIICDKMLHDSTFSVKGTSQTSNDCLTPCDGLGNRRKKNMSQKFVVRESDPNRRIMYIYIEGTSGSGISGISGIPQLSLNGSVFKSTTSPLVEMGDGHYYVPLSAAELSQTGRITLRFKSALTNECYERGTVESAGVFTGVVSNTYNQATEINWKVSQVKKNTNKRNNPVSSPEE